MPQLSKHNGDCCYFFWERFEGKLVQGGHLDKKTLESCVLLGGVHRYSGRHLSQLLVDVSVDIATG